MPITLYGADLFVGYHIANDMYLALCLSTPSKTSTGSSLDEVTAVDYTRVLVDSANWSVVTNGVSYYDTDIEHFPANSWGLITSWALLDSATLGGGNVLSYGNITPNMTYYAGAYAIINAGSLTIGVET
jgi:hypothetical protein